MITRTSFVVTFLTGMFVVATVSVVTSAAFFPISGATVDLSAGERIFARRCAACHTIVSDTPGRSGPSLHDIGRIAASRLPGVSAEQYIMKSIVEPSSYKTPDAIGEMPENVADDLSGAEIVHLTAFLCSRGGPVRYSRLLNLEQRVGVSRVPANQTVDLISAERGKQLFFGALNCADCHRLDGTPGSDLLAPNLTNVRGHSREYLREAILQPEKVFAPGYETWHVVQQGRLYTGRRMPSPAGIVKLLTVDARARIQLLSFAESKFESDESDDLVGKAAGSAMPAYRTVLNETDLTALLDFLSTL